MLIYKFTELDQIDDGGCLVGVGAGDGTTSVVRLDQSLVVNTKLNRNNATDMFERWDILLFS